MKDPFEVYEYMWLSQEKPASEDAAGPSNYYQTLHGGLDAIKEVPQIHDNDKTPEERPNVPLEPTCFVFQKDRNDDVDRFYIDFPPTSEDSKRQMKTVSQSKMVKSSSEAFLESNPDAIYSEPSEFCHTCCPLVDQSPAEASGLKSAKTWSRNLVEKVAIIPIKLFAAASVCFALVFSSDRNPEDPKNKCLKDSY